MKRILAYVALIAMIICMTACTAETSDKADTGAVSGADSISDTGSMSDEETISGMDNGKKQLALKTVNPIEYESFLSSYVPDKDSAANAAKSMTVDIGGKSITGSYKETIDTPFCLGDRTMYISSDIKFGICPETGKVASYTCSDPMMYEDKTQYTEDELFKMAVDFIVSIEPDFDPDNYVLQCTQMSRSACHYNFEKYINGIRTMDFVTVTVEANGWVSYYASGQVGVFDDLALSAINKSHAFLDIEDSISASLVKKFAEKGQKVRPIVEFDEEVGEYLYKCKDGTYALWLCVDVEEAGSITNGMYFVPLQ